jgi:L-ascorbate metabolism protein UlaG (beta-lactamase superfamily)
MRYRRDIPSRPAALGALAVLSLLLAAPPSAVGQVRGRSGGGKSNAPAKLHFLANEGFAIESAGKVVLIDALQTVGTPEHGELPESVYSQMLAGRPPFASVALILVSHPHKDHHVPSVAAGFLQRHPETRMAATPEVLKSLEGEPEFAAIQAQLAEVHTRKGSGVTFTAPGVSVDFLELPHLASEIYPVTVVGHLVQMGGKRVLHVGDAELGAEQLEGLGLAAKGVDVAILPYWAFAREGAKSLIAKQIAPKKVVAMRLPMGGLQEARRTVRSLFPDAIFFTKPMQSVRF